MEEVIWLRQLSLGEDLAFKHLYKHYYARLYAFAYKYLNSSEESKDTVQDVLYDLWKKKEHYCNVTALKSYLYTSTRNRCLDKLKHHKVQSRYLQTLREETDFFLNQVLEEEVYQQLKDAIKKLPPLVGKIFELTLLGHSNMEIATMLAISLDAVKSHKKRGKKLLQEKLYSVIAFITLQRH